MMTKERFVKRVTACTLAGVMVLSLTPMVKAGAKAKSPTLSQTDVTVEVGKTVKLKVNKKGCKVKSIKWSSSDSSVATVNKKGLVKGISAGDATVSAKVAVKKGKKNTLTCAVHVTDGSEGRRAGGWETATSPEIDATLKSIVEKAVAKENAEAKVFDLVPMALLATQEVSGENYRIFCKKIPAKLGGKATYAIVDFYVNLLGEATISEMDDSDIEAYGTGNASGWNETETPVIAKGEGLIFEKAIAGLEGVSYTPVAILATNKVRGTEYCYICEKLIIYPNEVPTYCFVYVSESENGEVKLSSIKDFDEPVPDADRAASPLVGSWKYVIGEGVEAVYTFNSDGTGKVEVYGSTTNFTYRDLGTAVEMSLEGTNPYEYPYTISGNTLTISDAAGNKIEYTRV